MSFRYPVIAFIALAAVGLSAQEQGGRGPGGPAMPGLALFQALDADHDNSLSPAEIDNAPAGLKALDKNGDGKVTADEFPAPRPFAGRGGGGEGRGRGGSGIGEEAPAAPTSPDELVSLLMAFDKNGDGKLSKSELPERFQGLLTRADTNKDGVLTADEIKKSAAAQPQPAAMPEGRRGGEGERGGGEGRFGGPDGRGGAPRPDLFLKALDLNGDGVLSADEIAAAPASIRKLDTNGDGIVSLNEILGGGRGRG